MAMLNNPLTLVAARGIFALCSRCSVIGRERVPREHDGLLIACTHLSYYDPATVSVLWGREIDWMARDEFFARPSNSWLIRQSGGFPISRFGCAVPGIRTALRRLRAGRVVGIFPEGEVVGGAESILGGGPMKEGVGFLVQRAQVPVVPCVALNSVQFKRVRPWLPLRSGRLWLGFGHPIAPDPSLPPGRIARKEMTRRVRQGMLAIYQELLTVCDVPPGARHA